MTGVVAAARSALAGRNLVLVGFMGTGKSTLGRVAARRLGRRFIDTDAEVEARAGLFIPEIFDRLGEEAFRALEAEVLVSVAERTGLVVATGGGALGRSENVAVLRANGVLVLLSARPDVLLRRVGGAEAAARRPLLAGPDPLARIRTLLTERQELYAHADLRLDTSDMGASEAVQALLALCARKAAGIRRG